MKGMLRTISETTKRERWTDFRMHCSNSFGNLKEIAENGMD
jgi:hypothetical protein